MIVKVDNDLDEDDDDGQNQNTGSQFDNSIFNKKSYAVES